MTNEQLIIEIKNKLIKHSGQINSAITRRNWFVKSELYQNIINNTSFLPDTISLAERIYCINNNILICPTCICGIKLRFTNSLVNGYSKFCSNKCSRSIEDKFKRKSSSEAKQILNEQIKNRFIECFKNNSYDIITENIIIEYIDKRLLESDYGRIHQFFNIKHYRLDINELCTILKMTEKVLSLPEKINIFEDFSFSERLYIIKNKISYIEKCPTCNKNKKYNNFLTGYANTCSKKCMYNNILKEVKTNINKQGFDVLNEDNIIDLEKSKYLVKCQKCGHIEERELFNARWKHIYCAGCYGDQGKSQEEQQVKDFINKELLIDTIDNFKIKRKKEIDILIKDKNLGIEYNGIYWHSTKNIEELVEYRYKHYKKLQECIELNIQLLTIFSYEWMHENKQKIWKSIIKNKLKLNNRIFARKCIIKIIDNNQISSRFLNENHLLGEDKSSIKLGLYYNTELVGLMTFCKSRFNKNYQWELSRYCSLIDINIVGGASKLFAYFIKNYNPKNIITYANLRYSTGELYKILGFKEIGISKPNYVYVKQGKIISRYNAQKHKLSKLLKEKYNENLSEIQNMLSNGYRIMFDCGNKVYEWIQIT